MHSGPMSAGGSVLMPLLRSMQRLHQPWVVTQTGGNGINTHLGNGPLWVWVGEKAEEKSVQSVQAGPQPLQMIACCRRHNSKLLGSWGFRYLETGKGVAGDVEMVRLSPFTVREDVCHKMTSFESSFANDGRPRDAIEPSFGRRAEIRPGIFPRVVGRGRSLE